MIDPEHAGREHDRAVRARLDPLVGELTGVGKMELATRLMFEAVRELAADRFGGRVIEGARAELPARHTGSSTTERDAAGRSSNTTGR